MKTNQIKIDSQFLVRVISNQVNETEREYFEKWLSESEENKEMFGTMALIWEEMDRTENPEIPDPKTQWGKISEQIKNISLDESSNQESQNQQPHLYTTNLRDIRKERSFWERNSSLIIRIAAVLIISFGFLYVYTHQVIDKPKKIFSEKRDFESTPNVSYERATAKGERLTFPLADGSIVYLNSDSRLIYPKYFSPYERKLELIGEAYFSVKPDVNKPFKVVCGDMTVVVTGTEFNIKNRDNNVKVVVAKGSVLTYSDKSPDGVSLKKGEMVSLEGNGLISRPVRVRLDDYLAWRQNKLAFSHTSLKEAMKEIERYYNIQVRFLSDANKERSITGVFQTDKTSLDDILNILSLTLDIKINHENNKIIVQ